MFKEINLSGCLSKLVSRVACWIKRENNVAGPFRYTGNAETGGLDGSLGYIFADSSSNTEYLVFGGSYTRGDVKHRRIGKEGIKKIISRPDIEKRKDKNIYFKELVLSDDVSPEVNDALRKHIRDACEHSKIQFEDLSLR